MARSQSEAIANTIIAAAAPLATKADLQSMVEQMATKTDFESINTRFENINTRIESAKHWLSSGLLVIALSNLVLTCRLNS
ncbi:MAG: hypothetical protein F4X09_09455 [Gammaproteobacteria bacterium]|nr:hypothetical protein [Gammaproteobacteria bacterium]